MKKSVRLPLIASLLFVLLVACSQDDSVTTPTQQPSIIGVWLADQYTTKYEDGYLHPQDQQEVIVSSIIDTDEWVNDETSYYWEYGQNGNWSQYQYDSNGVLSFQDDQDYILQGDTIFWSDYDPSNTWGLVSNLTFESHTMAAQTTEWEVQNDTLFFERETIEIQFSKSTLPD